MKKIAIYPGSFDPITNGHLDILKRALPLFDEVVIVVANNVSKKYMFTPKERLDMILDTIKEHKLTNVKAVILEGLVVKYAKEIGAKYLIRGLRAVSDFEYEFKLAATNNHIDNSIDMVFFMAHNYFEFISSSSVVEMASGGVDISSLVPRTVSIALKKKFNK